MRRVARARAAAANKVMFGFCGCVCVCVRSYDVLKSGKLCGARGEIVVRTTTGYNNRKPEIKTRNTPETYADTDTELCLYSALRVLRSSTISFSFVVFGYNRRRRAAADRRNASTLVGACGAAFTNTAVPRAGGATVTVSCGARNYYIHCRRDELSEVI